MVPPGGLPGPPGIWRSPPGMEALSPGEQAVKLDRRVDAALPRDTREQAELFRHLDYAYIGGRYRSEEEFPVTRDQLDYWAKETKKLLDITETVCRERIEALKKIERR